MKTLKDLLKRISLQEMLCYLAKESYQLIDTPKDSPFPSGAKLETYHMPNGKPYSHYITAWGLIDIAYQAILCSNDYRSQTVISRDEFGMIYNLFWKEDELREKAKPFIGKGGSNDYFFYLYGFLGEQLMFQMRHLFSENCNRDCLLMNRIFPTINKKINIEDIVHQEIGLSSFDLKVVLLSLVVLAMKEPIFPSKAFPYTNSILSQDNIQKVLNYYSVSYSQVRQSNKGRQVLYTNPIVRTDKKCDIMINTYLLLFVLGNSTYWIVRNYFYKHDSNEFLDAFGDCFEEYFKQLLEEYATFFEKIKRGKKRSADWYIKLGNYELIVEQKSALVSLFARQQDSDIEITKEYIRKNWLSALEQLEETAKSYKNDHLIKIVLVLDDYFKSEMLINVFKMPDNKVTNDGWYWCVSIRAFEILLYTYKTNNLLFVNLMEEKIRRTTQTSSGSDDFEIIFSSKEIYNNLYLEKRENNYFEQIYEALMSEVRVSSTIL
jgi:hypothetical protein